MCVLQGRMIYESEETRPWEDDIVALLEESKASVLDGVDDDQGSVGVHIVGSTINAIPEPDAQKLFASFAVAAEDVAMPMPVLELIWCSASSTAHNFSVQSLFPVKMRNA